MADDRVRYERNPNFIFRQIVDEAVLVPIQRQVADMDCIYTLSPVAASIWQSLDRPATPAELVAAIVEEYDVEPDVAAADLERFLGEMVAIGALHEV